VPDENYVEFHQGTETESANRKELSAPLEADTGNTATPPHPPESRENQGSMIIDNQKDFQKWASEMEVAGSERGRLPSPGRNPVGVIKIDGHKIEDDLEHDRQGPLDEPLALPREFALLPASFSLKRIEPSKAHGTSSAPPDLQQYNEPEDNSRGHRRPGGYGNIITEQNQDAISRESNRLLELMRIGSKDERKDSTHATAGLKAPTRAQRNEAKYFQEQGLIAYTLQNFPSAIDFWTKALILMPGDPVVLHDRTATYFLLSDHKNALADAEAAVAANYLLEVLGYLRDA
jgi:hypothetical protein